MSTVRLTQFACLLGAFLFTTAVAVAQEPLSGASREIVIDHRALANGPIPEWNRGLFMSRIAQSGRVAISDRDGNIVKELNLRLPDAPNITLADTAVSADGRYAVSGGAADNGGTGVTFIAWFDQDGNTSRVVRTSPFSPLRIAFADDGTLWVFGRVLRHFAGLATEPDHDTLRQYSIEGVLIDSFLPRSAFDSASHPASSAFLVTSGDRVGVYSASATSWIELSTSDGSIQSWSGAVFPDRFRVSGIGVTISGSAYVSVQHQIQNPAEGTTATNITRIYRLDRSTGDWIEVEFSDANTGHVYGADGNQLVIGTEYATFRWVPVP